MKMKVVDWISLEQAEGHRDIGSLGGFFKKGMRWQDYLAVWKPEAHPYLEALREEIVKRRIRFGGFWHQYDDEGVPVFEDGTVATFSMRGWGDLLAAIWSAEEDTDYWYGDFAWYGPEEEIWEPDYGSGKIDEKHGGSDG